GTCEFRQDGAHGTQVVRVRAVQVFAAEQCPLQPRLARRRNHLRLCHFSRIPFAANSAFARAIIVGRDASIVCRCTPPVSDESSVAPALRQRRMKSVTSVRDSIINEPRSSPYKGCSTMTSSTLTP